ncbi:MAG: polymerase suppressor [Cyphobasidiales sp. Tagirdzhanova-0007]|nr:MAG: polymerase suppressor [Cyphobasidiales sp. Tagirdzhanova-0007]
MALPEKLNAPSLPPSSAIYSHATKVQGLIFLSGQIGQDENKQLKDGVEAQCEQCIKNLTVVLKAAGSSWDHVVKGKI